MNYIYIYIYLDFNNFLNVFLLLCERYYFILDFLFINYNLSINFMLVTYICPSKENYNLIIIKKVIIV